MKDKINLFALVVATLASIAVAVSIVAMQYALTTAAHLSEVAHDAMRTLGWPDL